MPTDVLIFGAHPDDIECGVGGTALLMHEQAISFAIVDLTMGEMGSRGTPEQRVQEAQESAKFLGAESRENLNLGDTSLQDSLQTRRLIASVIRKHRPRIVLAPFWEDLHGDHVAAGLMVRNAALYCSLSKLDDPHPPHKPRRFLYYLLHKYHAPTFVVDISTVFERKLDAIRLYKSQFSKTADEYGVLPVGIGDYIFHLESRSRYFGSLANVKFGEPFVAEQPLVITSLSHLIG